MTNRIIDFIRPTKKKLVITIAIVILVFAFMFIDRWTTELQIDASVALGINETKFNFLMISDYIESTITFPSWQIQEICSEEVVSESPPSILCQIPLAGAYTLIIYYLIACIIAKITNRQTQKQ